MTTRAKNTNLIPSSKDSFYEFDYNVLDNITLNFFDAGKNSNKFYVAEVHATTNAGYSGEPYRLFINHGRVGQKGVAKAEPFTFESDARSKFEKKVREKRRSGYTVSDLATQAVGSSNVQKKVNISAVPSSVVASVQGANNHNFDKRIVKLIDHIYEETNQALSLSVSGTVKSDVSTPLGNLGVSGIARAREVLKALYNGLSTRGGVSQDYILGLNNEYYRAVPRKLPSNLNKNVSWVINSFDKIQKELDILDLYENSLRLLPVLSNLDYVSRYNALSCDIRCVDDAELLEYISHKVTSTKAPNHNFNLRVKDVFEISQKNAPAFDPSVGNVVRLFHGSRSANLVGILSSYLKIPTKLPNQVHKTGAMFGDGIYFAHNSTKSANYSFSQFGGAKNKHDTAYLFIAEVAMGDVYKTEVPRHFSKPPAGHHSVMGKRGANLVNDEFIVYNPTQVRLRYLIEVEKY